MARAALDAELEFAVDEHVVVLGPMGDVGRDLGEALCGPPPRSPARDGAAALELLGRGRQDEDADHVVAGDLAQLLRALPVDVEQHVAAGRERGLATAARGVP